jgi:hypothetical protein
MFAFSRKIVRSIVRSFRWIRLLNKFVRSIILFFLVCKERERNSVLAVKERCGETKYVAR